ncbi:MAG: helix-turn-helix domain-containing protein [Candidatus Aminicenantes bacterium]|nr:helix-turn-helix domain-containing protein [Candidatus Aminicenantes bacterium]
MGILIAALPALHFPGEGLWAQGPDKYTQEYLVDRWETADGLPGNSVLAITQTPDGYLWITTTKGLTRFDGLKFTAIGFLENGDDSPQKTLPDALFVDRTGILWIGSSAGLTQYDYKTRLFVTLTAKDGITADRIRVIDEDVKGNLWISFDVGYLNRFANGRFSAFNASHGLGGKKINAIVEDAGGNLLFGTRENGVYIFRGEGFSKYEIEGLGKGYLIITMYEDRDKDLWIGTNKGLFRATTKDNKTYVYTTRHGLAGDYIISILEDEDRNLWVGTANGLSRWEKKQAASASFSRVDLLKNHAITCLFNGRENSLWVGAYEGGIWQLKAARFSSCTLQLQEKRQEEIIFSLYEDRLGNTWIGTLSGKLYCCKNCTAIKTLEIPGISDTGISAIAEDSSGNLWLGANGKGVFMEEAGRFTNFTTRDGLADNMVISIFKDSKDNLWFATAGGVSRYSRSTRRLESFKTGGGLPRKVHNVYEDKNHNILLATDKGIMVMENKNYEFINNKMTGSCRDIPVTCIVQDDSGDSQSSAGGGAYWIATHGAGLKRFKNGTLTSYTTKEGMASNFIYQVFEDGWGNLWMMSDSGVLRASKNELNELADGRGSYINCTAFGISDGMRSIEFNNMFSRHSALKTQTGELRFITRKDIAVVNPGKININKIPPPVVIEAALLNGLAVPRECYGQDGKKNVFKKIQDVVFLFTAPTFLSPEKVTFKYKLEGSDMDWVFLRPGKRRAAHYKDLAPGAYSFSVTACNSDGVWNETGVSFAFTLKSPIYETLLFKLGMLILLAGLGWAGYFLYKRLKPLFPKTEDSKRTAINPLFAEQCIKKLSYLMELEKLYREESISLQYLAEKLSITPHLLSQLLNEKLNITFPDYINNYRIEEARKLLVDPDWADRKVISIAFEVGYNTKAAFYGVFKKCTGMTPSEYRKTRNPKSKIACTNKSK